MLLAFGTRVPGPRMPDRTRRCMLIRMGD